MTFTGEAGKIIDLWDYTAEKVGESEATGLLDHMGLDNPHITKLKTLEECKRLVDKFLLFRKILRGK